VIGQTLVIDGVAHGLDFCERSRWKHQQLCEFFEQFGYFGIHLLGVPGDEPQWALPYERYAENIMTDVDIISSAFFRESWTDAVVYQGVPLFGMYTEGLSPLRFGLELRERHPGRVFLYGPVSPFQDDPIGEMDRLIDEDKVDGIKLYPVDGYGEEVKSYGMDDPELAFPLLEHAQKRGVKSVAVHKAVPLGPVPIGPFKVDDVDGAFMAFPDLPIEVVHSGFAFLDESAFQVARFHNCYVNLEATSSLLAKAPRKFMEILAAFLQVGGAERILWGTGCTAVHAQPLLDRFWNLEFPEDIMDKYGVPQLDEQTKSMIVGENMAKLLKIDTDELRSTVEADDSRADGLAKPWSGKLVEAG
jgi:predicted TIM-barrel fold metal-dependent hydrolase